MTALGACGQRLQPPRWDTGALERCQKPRGCPKRPSAEVGVRERQTSRLLPQKRNGASGIQAEDARA
jgi:hypothetical protein